MIGNELNPINTSTNIDDVATRDNINIVLDKVTSDTFLTPYIGLERVSKALAYYHIFLPKMTFLEEERGYKLFKASQFGDKMGMTNDGQVVMNDNPEYSVYFEWNKNYNGVYDIFCQIADHNEVNELISDFEDDIEEDYEDEDEDEEYNQELDEEKSNKRKRKTVLVVVKKPKTEAGKKAKRGGGGVFRLPKSKYDRNPRKYDPVSEQKESEQLDEISEEKVRVPHNGKMVVGTVRRRDPGNNKMGILPFHVVDVGDKSGSIKVPNHKVKNLDEKLNKSDPTSKWISDFVKSDDPKFEGKSKKERIKMALGAYYAAQRNEEAEQIEEAATIVRGLGKIVSALKRGIPHEEIAKKHGVHPDTIKSLHDTLKATQKTFPNVKHFTSKGHPDWKKHGIDEASWHQQKSGVNPRHPDSWAVHHNPPGEHASSILFKKKEEAEAHIKAQKEAGRGEHLYLLPPRKPMSEARKTFADYARKSFGNRENLERIKAEIEANRKKHKKMMKKSASVTPKD